MTAAMTPGEAATRRSGWAPKRRRTWAVAWLALLLAGCTTGDGSPTTTPVPPPAREATPTHAPALPDAVPVVAEGVSGRLLRHAEVPSRHVAARNVDVWLPPGYDADDSKRYPVLYMQDGQNLFVPAQTLYGVDWGVDEAMLAGIADGSLPEAIVVGIWNTPLRAQEYMPQAAVTVPMVATGVDWMPPFPADSLVSDDYLDFIVGELKPAIDARYRTQPGAGSTFVMGSSMGGLISLYALARHPQVFGGAAALSTHWPAGDGAMVDWFAAHLPTRGHRLWFDHGDRGLDAAYAPYQQRMDAALRASPLREGEDWTSQVFPGADHSEPDWRARLHLPLRFLLGHDGY